MKQHNFDLLESREADAEHERMRNKPYIYGGYVKIYIDPENPNNTIFER